MANPAKVLARVQTVENHGEGVYSVTFAVPSRYTRYLPGQFLHMTLEEFDPTAGFWPESRVFSIASAPRQDFVAIVYSVKGRYTRLMEQELAVGREVWLKLPYGDFIVDEGLLADGPVVLIAGGTGVSPYLPFLMKHRESGNVHLFYGLRKPNHLLFRDEFSTLKGQPWFRPHFFLEEGRLEDWPSTPGRLSIPAIAEAMGKEFPTGQYFLSGPPAMIRTFQDDLLGQGIPNNQIHIDEWE